MEISPLGVGPATQAWVTIVVARDGARGRSRRNFRRLSTEEGWKGGALIMPEDVSPRREEIDRGAPGHEEVMLIIRNQCRGTMVGAATSR